jgi:phosphoribosylformylglycinamidine cyclo-ligase
VPPLFAWLQRAGGIADEEMFRAFNMGVGMVLVCAAEHATALLGALHEAGEPAWRLGDVR